MAFIIGKYCNLIGAQIDDYQALSPLAFLGYRQGFIQGGGGGGGVPRDFPSSAKVPPPPPPRILKVYLYGFMVLGDFSWNFHFSIVWLV